jgi:hypothetical protein
MKNKKPRIGNFGVNKREDSLQQALRQYNTIDTNLINRILGNGIPQKNMHVIMGHSHTNSVIIDLETLSKYITINPCFE